MRLLADGNMGHAFIHACLRLKGDFPIIHIADWRNGAHRTSEDPVLLEALREHNMIVIGFDRSSMGRHAGELTRNGSGHAGVILFRRSVSQSDYGKQSRVLVNFWKEAAEWDWADRIEYLPRG